jgi:hypothetical protein
MRYKIIADFDMIGNKYEHLVTRLPVQNLTKEQLNLKEFQELLSSMKIGDIIFLNTTLNNEMGLTYEQMVKLVDMTIGYGNLSTANLDCIVTITKQRE